MRRIVKIVKKNAKNGENVKKNAENSENVKKKCEGW